MADAARANGTRYIYMTQPWIVALFLDCEHSGVRGWRPQRSGPLLQCPNASTVAQFRRACTNGDIFFQAFPHNACPESYDASLFEARVSPRRGRPCMTSPESRLASRLLSTYTWAACRS